MSTIPAWDAVCAARWRMRRCCVPRFIGRSSYSTPPGGIEFWHPFAARSSDFCSAWPTRGGHAMSTESGAVLHQPGAASSSPTQRPLRIAIAALGGQGGGVLADWIVEVAERYGWLVQATSVPGVAQRTGTTVYYLETCPPSAGGAEPVF